VHHPDQGQVRLAGKAVLDHLGIGEERATEAEGGVPGGHPRVEPYHAQIINKMRFGDMLIAGESLFILEVEPAGYVASRPTRRSRRRGSS